MTTELNRQLPVPEISNKRARKLSKRRAKKPVEEGSAGHVLQLDIEGLLEHPPLSNIPFERFQEIEVDIVYLSSSGDGIGLVLEGRYAVVVPFSLPGDRVKAKLHFLAETYALADFLEVLTPSKDRDDNLIGCKYFGKCGGCQYQMLPYEKQLQQKKKVIEKAFRYFSKLDPSKLPQVESTVGSPLQYNYRTKITPHFDVPKGGTNGPLTIGFQEKGRRRVLDIEECPIATKKINESYPKIIGEVQDRASTYKRGATILMRDSMNDDGEHSVITDHKAIVTESFGDFKFVFPAGAFFQNNNSILPDFTGYVRKQLLNPFGHENYQKPKYFVDAYCGSGLFSVACSEGFDSVIGVEISADSVHYAKENAQRNNVSNTNFIVGEAEKIFSSIETPSAETAMVVDPPRKGCDQVFLNQLLEYGPSRVVYISCNVHTQARDVGYILHHELGKNFKIDEIRGFDLFPQSHHVESILTLTKLN
ncbi:tRNA methyltransferase Trm2 [Schizosaccharomyces octosporus yFS286]|uniref:tRNA (uracil(54)-C(5))-methyltransferase n=1 Tax=Schizosaccharomyces octosporus (strain yFS286) TaxID=483514 RepID=S9Q393_SCHOY|nr:tRNA methyltransferase Trm2 [Schizosaccharomyces octosporus yFS286]EPX74557.1 tRNA methyltransferase Trm2 [Schizosaccharomyces octosporus yFS286]